MRKLVLIAAMLMASASAHAGSFNFKIEGHKVRVDIPRGCSSLSCINISAPTITDKFKSKDDEEDTSSSTSATAPAAAPEAAPQAAATVPTAPAPATAAAQPSSKVSVLPAPASDANAASTSAPTVSAPSLAAPDASAPPAPAPAPVAAPAPAPASVQVAAVAPAPAPAAVRTTASPLGLWMSEKKEGKIRIEDCNGNLCGYAVDAKTGANGAKVLINMKPRGERWAGRIKDTRSGGVYDSTIALRGNDKLKVQGCAFGGMFCGGETWTRIQ